MQSHFKSCCYTCAVHSQRNSFEVKEQMPTITSIPRKIVWGLLTLLGIAALLHLNADFPHHSRWIDDAARFADEGWYASGALNHILTGHWLRPGDFNPVVTIPVWSFLLDLLFHFTGISLASARGLAVLFTSGTVLLSGMLVLRTHQTLAPAFMLLIAASPLLFFFSRSALLESPLIFFLIASALAADRVRSPLSLQAALCGALFALAMLVKSSALFVAPAILYLLWSRCDGDRRAKLRTLLVSSAVYLAPYGLYWLLCIHTHPADIRTLYNENPFRLEARSLEKCVRVVYRSVTWIDPVLFPLALAAVAASLGKLRRLWQEPLFVFALLWYLGYATFSVLHFDAEPHYFAVLVPPVMLVLVLFLESLETTLPALAKPVGALVLLVVTANLCYIAKLMLHPDYSLRDACLHIRQQIEDDPTATPLVIGHGAMLSTYYTHVSALDDMGAMTVAEKLQTYHPGWVVTYSDNFSLLNLPNVRDHYSFIETGNYPVFDVPQRSRLLLYRIQPK
jgi:4-amino-4-deoxy-L-arabinose transferase-like glycosyltransferase